VSGRLPDGFTVSLGRKVRMSADGRELVGGSPTRVLYLTEAAGRMLADRTIAVTSDATAGLVERLLLAGMADPVVGELPVGDPAEVTWVIPVRDRPLALERLLASIELAAVSATVSATARVIVVDDASRDPAETVRIATKHGAQTLMLHDNVGPAGARNAGLALVETALVAFVDSDVVVQPDALPLLLRHFADPQVAVVAPRVLGFHDSAPNWIGRYEDARSSLDLGPFPALVRPVTPVSWVSSTFLLARVSALGDGFDAGMRVGEDVDLAWRLDAAGWRVRYEPAAIVRHEHRTTTRDWLARKAFYGTGAHPLSLRHPHNIAPAVLAPWSAGVLVAMLAQRRWSIPVAAGLTVVAAARIARKVRTRSEHPYLLGARLAGAGATAAASQGMSLLIRHWWPLAAVGAVISPRIRRAIVVAAVIDTAIEYRRTKPHLDPIRFGIARRLDDLAYGAGVWLGAIRGRSLGALLPDIRSKR
jgi:mycofactocin system glycosyltransferase